MRLERLTLSIDGRALTGELSLEISAGQRLCIVGQAGTGKSLLLELMAGQRVPHQGHFSYPAWIDAYPDAALGVPPRFAVQLVSTSEQRRICSRYASFHQARWHASFTEPGTVDEFLGPRQTMGLRAFEEPPSDLVCGDHNERRQAILEDLGVAYLLPRRMAALSNGEWRKLLLARALLAQPRLLLLDDPLGGLDPDARLRVIEVLSRHCVSRRTADTSSAVHQGSVEPNQAVTMVFTSPRPEELSSLATGVFQLEATSVSVPHRPTQKSHQTDAAVAGDSTAVPTTDPVLRLRAATVRAGAITLLDAVSLQVMRGQHWLITGPNGAGKSTLLALLMGDHPQSYVVDLEVLGLRAQPGVSLFERQRRIGFMAPELAAHYPPLWSTREVVLSGLNASIGQFTEPTFTDCQLADNWLDRLDLSAYANSPLAALCEVDLRKVFLARALVRRPALLILDEPTQGLQAMQRTELFDILDDVVTRSHLTIIMVSHHALERPRCITHHLALDRGRVVSCGPLQVDD